MTAATEVPGHDPERQVPHRLGMSGPGTDRAALPAPSSSPSDFRRKSFVFKDGPFQLETVNTVI